MFDFSKRDLPRINHRKIKSLVREVHEYYRKSSPRGAAYNPLVEEMSIEKMLSKLKSQNNSPQKKRAATYTKPIRRFIEIQTRISEPKPRRTIINGSLGRKKQVPKYDNLMRKIDRASVPKLPTPPPIYQKFLRYMEHYTEVMERTGNTDELNRELKMKFYDQKIDRRHQRDSLKLLKEMESAKANNRRKSVG